MMRFDSRKTHRLKRKDRRGATTIEMALVLMAFLILVFGMLDLGIAVFRQHVLSSAARIGTRKAIVHGSMAIEPWKPSNSWKLEAVVRDSLVGFDPEEVTITPEWLDGGNDASQEHRVRVTVSADYTPMMTFIFGSPTIELRASSTMVIAH